MWRSILTNDEDGMMRATEAFGLHSKFYKLISLIFTFSTNDAIIPGGGTLPPPPTEFDSAAMQKHQDAMAKALGLEDVPIEEQMNVMQDLPRELFLLLKTNNLLRFVNQQLDSPINRFRVMAKSAIRNIHEEEMAKRPGWKKAVVLKLSEIEYAFLAWAHPFITAIRLFFAWWA